MAHLLKCIMNGGLEMNSFSNQWETTISVTC